MENNRFNAGRFWKYFAHDFLRCTNKAGLATLATALIPVILLIGASCTFAALGIRDWTLDTVISVFVASVTSVLYFLLTPITCYGELTDRRKGSSFLMLPASHTEKFASLTIISVIIFPAIFCALYLGTDALCAALFPARMESPLAKELGRDSIMTFFLPAMVSAAGLCGAVLFKTRKASKTFLTCAVSFIVLFLVLITVSENSETGASIDFDLNAAINVWYIFQAFCAICCLGYVYFKTKKIQL